MFLIIYLDFAKGTQSLKKFPITGQTYPRGHQPEGDQGQPRGHRWNRRSWKVFATLGHSGRARTKGRKSSRPRIDRLHGPTGLWLVLWPLNISP